MSTSAFLLLLIALPADGAIGPQPVMPPEVPVVEVQTGTLLFSKGDCLAVKVFTGSTYTHVAMVCCNGDEFVVYDANPGTGVRRQELSAYLSAVAPDRIQTLHPVRRLKQDEEEQLRGFLESKLGTPYAVLHHVTGRRGGGVHCSELMTDALSEIRWLTAKSPPRVSPGSLMIGITAGQIYAPGDVYEIPEPVTVPETGDNRCEQLWIDTKLCCSRCCRQLSRIFLCRD